MGIHMESSVQSLESGYASGASSTDSLPQIVLSKQHLKFLNNTLNNLAPIDILRWCKITFPNLYQITAFGLSGLVTLDMLSKIQEETPNAPSIDAIFYDTLYHFQETHALVEKAKKRYPHVYLHIYKPEGVETAAQFEAKHGKELWKTDDKLYDWVAKVEPAQRAYSDLSVAAVLTGRRRSQGAKRESLEIIEVDDAGVIKINPLASWSFKQVKEYITANDVPFNELLDRGYKSVGDWHSTEPVKEGEDERAGRWKGQNKTECGIHNKKSVYAQFLFDAEQKRQQEELAAALSVVDVMPSSPEQTETVAEITTVTPIEQAPVVVEAVVVTQEQVPVTDTISTLEELVVAPDTMEGIELPAPTFEAMEGVETSPVVAVADAPTLEAVSEVLAPVPSDIATLEHVEVAVAEETHHVPAVAEVPLEAILEQPEVSEVVIDTAVSEQVEVKAETATIPILEQTEISPELASAMEKLQNPEFLVEAITVQA